MWFKGVLDDAVALVEGNFFSTGGDEINQKCMVRCPIDQCHH